MIRLTLAALLLAGTCAVAQADNDADKTAMKPGWLTTDQVSQRLQSQGYTISKIKLDDGAYKVKAMSADHHKTKLEISPASGAVLSSKTDDGDDD